jgi:hypothetical protein
MFRAHLAHHQERQIVSIQPLVTVILCWWPSCVQVGSLQFVTPDDEHDVLETYTELKIEINTQEGICALRWSFTKNHYMMHSQQNVKFLITVISRLLVKIVAIM